MTPGYMLFIIIAGILSFVGMIVQRKLKSKFNKYSRMGISSGMSGAEVAQTMLNHYNVADVKVAMGKGFLSDHYNPVTKTVTLSPPVFQGRNVASAAVAAHECGHAVQHATAYSMLALRSKLVPLVKGASIMQQYLLIGAFLLLGSFPQLMLIAIAAFGITTLFSFITLPVEFDASKRALVWLDDTGITQGVEYDGAKDALWWAAITYVVGALTSFIMFVYLILSYLGRD